MPVAQRGRRRHEQLRPATKKSGPPPLRRWPGFRRPMRSKSDSIRDDQVLGLGGVGTRVTPEQPDAAGGGGVDRSGVGEFVAEGVLGAGVAGTGGAASDGVPVMPPW